MQTLEVLETLPSEGFLLLDSEMNPILVNPAAAQILAYPQKPEKQKNLDGYLTSKIRSTIVFEKSLNRSAVVPRFQSGRRTYRCRSFQVNSMSNENSQGTLAVLFERASARSAALSQLSERFHLTAREKEVALFLSQGLTSKEIGTRMGISPNTVKAFLRLIMMKMHCTTRSGIVGKVLTLEL